MHEIRFVRNHYVCSDGCCNEDWIDISVDGKEIDRAYMNVEFEDWLRILKHFNIEAKIEYVDIDDSDCDMEIALYEDDDESY